MKKYVMTSNCTCIHQKVLHDIKRHYVEKYIIMSKSSSWHYKYVVMSRVRHDVKTVRHDVKTVHHDVK